MKQTRLRRRVWDPRNTELGIGKWAWPYLDTSTWWMDAWETDVWRYLHCPLKDADDFDADSRVRRVYPRVKQGRSVTLSMHDGELFWVYAQTQAEFNAAMDKGMKKLQMDRP